MYLKTYIMLYKLSILLIWIAALLRSLTHWNEWHEIESQWKVTIKYLF